MNSAQFSKDPFNGQLSIDLFGKRLMGMVRKREPSFLVAFFLHGRQRYGAGQDLAALPSMGAQEVSDLVVEDPADDRVFGSADGFPVVFVLSLEPEMQRVLPASERNFWGVGGFTVGE